MKYAIYDKAANRYLTDMGVDIVCSSDTRLTCAYAEYITDAKLLDTKESATDIVTRIEGFKFMDKGLFVIHSFDDTLKDQYIISEAGTPTKVVDNITVDLDGTVNVKYGTMLTHWSTASLEYAINRMNALQKAVSAIYTSWNDTFMVYKVITIMDEKEHTHYQFINRTIINRTITGLAKAEHDEEKKLLVAGKEITDIVYPLNKRIEELEKANYELGEQVAERGSVANRLLDENNSLKAKVEHIKKEARDWKKLYENASDEREELKNIIDKAQKAEKALEDQKKLNDANKATIAYLTINKMANDKELSDLKRRVEEVEKSLNNQLELNHGVCDENRKLRIERDCTANIIYAILNAIVNGDAHAFNCIESRMRHDSDFNSGPFMAGVRENVKDICAAEKKNIANHDLKNNEIARLTEERDKALEQKEFYKRQANSVYGFVMPIRCCGKQVMADILSGKKIPVDKKKYDDLVEKVFIINERLKDLTK